MKGHIYPIRWTPERDQEAIALRQMGLSFTQIGDRLRVSHQNVFHRLRTLDAAALNKPAKPFRNTKKKPAGKQRPCLCCGRTFTSAGPHNRLCDSCRRRDISPYAA